MCCCPTNKPQVASLTNCFFMALSETESFPDDINSTDVGEVDLGVKDEMSPCCPGQNKSSAARQLTQEELDRLGGERTVVSDFKQTKLEKEAQKNWDLFYKRNTTHFFKDRHWTTREFEELKACREVRRDLFGPRWFLSIQI